MYTLLTQVDSWLTATVLAVLMLAGWGLGWWRGRRLAEEKRAAAGTFNEAVMALLGLLLAFTFSLSLAKHEHRLMMTVTDSNALGDFYTCASLVKGPVRGELQSAIRTYVEYRLELAKGGRDKDQLDEALAEIAAMHSRMQGLVGKAVEEGTPVTIPLVNTFNGVTSSHAARLASLRDRLPPSIVVLLFLTALVTMVLVGKQQGTSGKFEPGATLGFIGLISLVVWVILDLNQPERGLITVSQEPMQRVLSGMDK